MVGLVPSFRLHVSGDAYARSSRWRRPRGWFSTAPAAGGGGVTPSSMMGNPSSNSGNERRDADAGVSGGVGRGLGLGAQSSQRRGWGGLGSRLSSVSPAGRSSDTTSSSSSSRDDRKGQSGTNPSAGTHAGGDSGKSAAASEANSGGGGGGGGKLGAAPWLARGLKALVRGGRGGDTGTQLPSLGAVMDAVDERGAQDEAVAAAGRSKMEGVMSSELPAHPQVRCLGGGRSLLRNSLVASPCD